MKGSLAALLMAASLAAPAWGDTTPAATTPALSTTPGTAATAPSAPQAGSSAQGAAAAQAPAGQQPVPYAPEEFPGWLRDIRRGEVILIGSFPITLLFTSFFYQVYRYAANNFTAQYAPGLFGASTIPLTTDERIQVLISGAVVSAVVAIIDYILGKTQKPSPQSGAP